MKGSYTEIAVDQIDVGERRRADFGDIAGLAEGIRRVGLLEPILVDRNGGERYRLVFGERRLRAVTLLKWPTIRAQLVEHLSDEQFREIELEENDNRKSLTDAERARTFASSKRLVENAKRAAEVLEQSDPKPATGPKGGRPSAPDSTRSVAAALGTSHMSVVRAEQHVATAERFPFMQSGQWRQSDVLAIRERIEELPEPERDQAADVLGCAKLMDPALAVNLMENLGAKKPEERSEIYRLSQSADPRERSLALTKAAELPPMPDPRLGILENVIRMLGAATKPYPDDPLTPRLAAARAELRLILAAVKEVSYDASRRPEGRIQ